MPFLKTQIGKFVHMAHHLQERVLNLWLEKDVEGVEFILALSAFWASYRLAVAQHWFPLGIPDVLRPSRLDPIGHQVITISNDFWIHALPGPFFPAALLFLGIASVIGLYHAYWPLRFLLSSLSMGFWFYSGGVVFLHMGLGGAGLYFVLCLAASWVQRRLFLERNERTKKVSEVEATMRLIGNTAEYLAQELVRKSQSTTEEATPPALARK